MTLPGHVFTAPDGVRGFDTAEKVSAALAAAFRRRVTDSVSGTSAVKQDPASE